jgi:hypothetical protein
MIAAETRRRALPIAAIVALVALALWPWLRWASETPARPAVSAMPASLRLPALPSLEQLRETAERPLFAPDRRPAATTHPAAVPLGFRLEGVVAIGTHARAIIKRPDGTTARVVEGDTVGEWTVRRIEPGRVVLTASERRLELTVGRPAPAGTPTR